MIRLQRVGRKNDPSFRVVVVDSKEASQSGKAIEVLGSHDARNDRTELKAERINYWFSVGAKASNTVNNLLIKKGIKEGKAIDVSSKKLGKKASAAVATAKAAEEKAAKASADAKAMADKKAEEEVTVVEPVAEEIKEDIAAEEVKEEVAIETPVEPASA
ncbi:MAG: 30S ribosomal protein S16 [Candidatus Paceibacterota bacterium]